MSAQGHSSGNDHADGANLAQEVQWLKADSVLIRNAVVLLEQEKDNLRQAVRKLKLENGRVKEKVKKLQAEVRRLGGGTEEDSDDVDYDELGRDFLLVGGAMDPLALRYEVKIRDEDGIEHKSAERYYWYKMAAKFGDEETMKKILEAPTTQKAEDAMKAIKGFNEAQWDTVKLSHWEHGQQLKLEQVRWILCLLVETGNHYIAVAHQDKLLGTGWRKNREESNKPIFWDGANAGGKFLMKYRKTAATKHEWAGPNEQEEAHRKFIEMKKFMWRRIDANRMGGGGPPGGPMGGMLSGGGGLGGGRGGYGVHHFGGGRGRGGGGGRGGDGGYGRPKKSPMT